MADFVTEWVCRFDTLARLDCDVVETEKKLFALVDNVRRDAGEKHWNFDEVVLRLETLAHDAEVPATDVLEARDQCERLRYAGVLRRSASLLSGPEKDLTPPPP
jgi:hypothetical protein